jgi:hypothetical protein
MLSLLKSISYISVMMQLLTCINHQCKDNSFDENLNELNMTPKVALEYLTKIHKTTVINSFSN